MCGRGQSLTSPWGAFQDLFSNLFSTWGMQDIRRTNKQNHGRIINRMLSFTSCNISCIIRRVFSIYQWCLRYWIVNYILLTCLSEDCVYWVELQSQNMRYLPLNLFILESLFTCLFKSDKFILFLFFPIHIFNEIAMLAKVII